jgi:hypothetical protein
MEIPASPPGRHRWWEATWIVVALCSFLGANALAVLYAVHFRYTLLIGDPPRYAVARSAAWFGVAMILPAVLAVSYGRAVPADDGVIRRWPPTLAVLAASALGIAQLAAWCF